MTQMTIFSRSESQRLPQSEASRQPPIRGWASAAAVIERRWPSARLGASLRSFSALISPQIARFFSTRSGSPYQSPSLCLVSAAGALRSGLSGYGGIGLLWVAAVLTGITGWDYFTKARAHLGED